MFTTAEKRALAQLSTVGGRLAVVAADQRGKMRAALAGAGIEPHIDTLRAIKRDLVTVLGGEAPAMLLDPEIALPDVIDAGLLPPHTGLLVSVEVSGAPLREGHRPAALLDRFGAAGVRRMGGTAAKLLVYVRGDREGLDSHNARIVARVAADCAAHDLLLVVEGLVFQLEGEDPAQFAARKPELVRQTALLLEAAGARYLKLECPGDERACAAVTDALTIPWALLSAGVDHETFVGQLRGALAGGAGGFIAGRSIWKECVTMDGDARRAFLEGEGRRRLDELMALVA